MFTQKEQVDVKIVDIYTIVTPFFIPTSCSEKYPKEKLLKQDLSFCILALQYNGPILGREGKRKTRIKQLHLRAKTS